MPAPDNCRCCVGSTCEPTDPTTCGSIHGECKSEGGCFAQSVLYLYLQRVTNPEQLLFAGGTLNALDELRDRLLTSSKVGAILLNYNRAFEKEGTALVRKNPRILREWVYAFLIAASFSRAMLREMNTQGSEKKRQWTSECAQLVEKVVTKVSKLTDDKTLQRALQHILEVNRRCTDQNVPAVLRLILSGETFLPND